MNDKGERTDDIVAGDRVRAVLERAAHLDASGLTGINRFELQKIAEEAGISAEAFNQAMQEEMMPTVERAPNAPEEAWWRRNLNIGKAASTAIPFGIIGAVFGVWAGSITGAMAPSVVAVLGISLFRALAHRKDRDAAMFRTEVICMFATLWAAYGMTGPVPQPEIMTGIPVTAVLAALIGTLVVQFRIGGEQNAVPASAR